MFRSWRKVIGQGSDSLGYVGHGLWVCGPAVSPLWVLDSCSIRCLPFTVTIPVTSGELSIAVESRDANLMFGKFQMEQLRRFDVCPLIADDSRHRPDIA